MSTSGTQTEFDFGEFDTEVSREDEDRVIETIADSIQRLRDQIDDDILQNVFTRGPGEYVLRSDFTRDQLDPEPITQSRVIEPLFETLGYENYGLEAGDFSSTRGEQADYAVSLRDVSGVDSTRLLIEAEPINKPLEGRGHGLDQVKSWLSQREFESDFGFATDGVRWIFIRYDADSYSHNIIEHVDLRPVFLTLFENAATAAEPPISVLSDEERELVSRLVQTFDFDNFLSIIDDAEDVIKEKQEEITDEFYEDYIRIVFGVGDDDEDERLARSLVGNGIVPPDDASGDEVRLFGVELMNRLIYIKFLEDKGIVRPDLLRTITETYEGGVYPQSLYKSFFDPLFYDVLNEKPADRTEQVDNIELYSDIPYLNGGLFRPELNDSSDLDEHDFDVRDSVLLSIVELLERYQFSADGGPSDIDPSILGNVFEKTINYITTDDGDQNKELGAYYTPSEITRFCAEQTVRPGIMERFQEVLIEEREWPRAEVEQYDTLYELIDGLPGSGNLITSLLSEMDDFYVLDPGMGSGHFLTSVLEEIVNIRQALYVRMDTDESPSRHRLKKTTVLNNIYGVDIVGPAVEIGKLRLWLSIISELTEGDVDQLSEDELALPNIAFNMRQGNSLIGFTGFSEEANSGDSTFERYQDDSVRTRYENIIEEIHSYQNSITNEQAEHHRQNAHELLEEAKIDLRDEIKDEFIAAGIEDITDEDIKDFSAFHWVLEFAEVFNDGGFDVIVGNPPWEVLTPRRDEFFARYDSKFRTRSSGEKDEVEDELLQDESIQNNFEKYTKNMQRRADYFNDSESYKLQSPKVDGKTVSNNQNELSALFLERILSLAAEDGYVSQVLPGTIFSGQNTKDVRLHLLDSTDVQSIIGFENQGIFDGLHGQYKFAITTFKNSGETEVLRGTFQQRDTGILNNFQEYTIEIPRLVLADYSPNSGVFPFVSRQEEVEVLNEILRHPQLSKDIGNKWRIEPYAELHRSKDSEYFVENEDIGDYPIYEGKNIYQFEYDNSHTDLGDISLWGLEKETNPDKSGKRMVRNKGIRSLKRAIYDAFDGDKTSKSQVKFVNELLERKRGEPLSEEDILPDCTEYRIVIRQVTNKTNERTLVASVLPKEVQCVHSLLTIRPYTVNLSDGDLSEYPLRSAWDRVFSDEELFTALGLLNSIPFDFLIRTKVESNMVMYKLRESQMPRLTSDDEWFDYIWTRAAKLNCYGEEFAEMRERLDIEAVEQSDQREILQAELDAGAFHAYGLSREQTAFVLDDFYQVANPRRMTDNYFDLVLEKYDELSEQ